MSVHLNTSCSVTEYKGQRQQHRSKLKQTQGYKVNVLRGRNYILSHWKLIWKRTNSNSIFFKLACSSQHCQLIRMNSFLHKDDKTSFLYTFIVFLRLTLTAFTRKLFFFLSTKRAVETLSLTYHLFCILIPLQTFLMYWSFYKKAVKMGRGALKTTTTTKNSQIDNCTKQFKMILQWKRKKEVLSLWRLMLEHYLFHLLHLSRNTKMQSKHFLL